MDLHMWKQELHSQQKTLCVVGLGYVGLPLARALAQKKFSVIGYDIDGDRIDKLRSGIDHTTGMTGDDLLSTSIELTDQIHHISKASVYFITVPTPISKNNTPDLTAVRNSMESVGRSLSPGDLVVLESTVYPGCTQEFCLPILEDASGLEAGVEFFLAYSPERINPGDARHGISNSMKVVAGHDQTALEMASCLYGQIVDAGIHVAPNIKVAEAAKLLENVQRDLNIALMNEMALICDRLQIHTHEVIEAAGTKWNFHSYYPGLVGGHCISVDPYYLTFKAEELGYFPEVILSGRRVNDRITGFIAKKVIHHLSQNHISLRQGRMLIMGLAYKENVGDLRNSKALDLVAELGGYHLSVDLVDPHVDIKDLPIAMREQLVREISGLYDAVIIVVGHDEFKKLGPSHLQTHLKKSSLIFDIKGIFQDWNWDQTYIRL